MCPTKVLIFRNMNFFPLFYAKTGAQHPRTGQNIQRACLRFYTQSCLDLFIFVVGVGIPCHIMVGMHC